MLTVRSIPDIDRVCAIMDQEQPTRAVVVGGGFIGIEMAENLVERGMHVAIVEMASHVIKSLDADMACDLHAELRAHDVELHLNTGVSAIEEDGDALVVRTSDDATITCDFVIMATGVRPESSLAAEAGITAVDTVWSNYKDEDGFAEEVKWAKTLGFTGKSCIHPAQIKIAHKLLSPSEEEIEHAQRIVDAEREAAAAGIGVFTVDNKMVDYPIINKAKRILIQAGRLEK